jgi:endonuclease YncB( thermonuclease family)
MLSRVWSFPGFAAALPLFAAATGENRPDGGPRLVAAEALAGPVPAKGERVVDGDTIDVRADICLGQTLLVRVRIDGVDAPELEARCPEERKLALAAREFLARRLGVYGKYGGRVGADVADNKGDVGEALLAAGLARPYHGERRASWCVQT